MKAFEFFQLAAKGELNIALDFLATCYECGYGIPKGRVKTFELYNKSAENGFIPSQHELFQCYEVWYRYQSEQERSLKMG